MFFVGKLYSTYSHFGHFIWFCHRLLSSRPKPIYDVVLHYMPPRYESASCSLWCRSVPSRNQLLVTWDTLFHYSWCHRWWKSYGLWRSFTIHRTVVTYITLVYGCALIRDRGHVTHSILVAVMHECCYSPSVEICIKIHWPFHDLSLQNQFLHSFGFLCLRGRFVNQYKQETRGWQHSLIRLSWIKKSVIFFLQNKIP